MLEGPKALGGPVGCRDEISKLQVVKKAGWGEESSEMHPGRRPLLFRNDFDSIHLFSKERLRDRR